MFSYKLKKKKLACVEGDPSWPKPKYIYTDCGEIKTSAPVSIGHYVLGYLVTEIRHEFAVSTIIVRED